MVASLSRLITIVLFCSVPFVAMAQPAQTTQPTAAPAQPATASDQPLLKTEQLDQLVAPIALYPDALLSQVLIAATYPLEVVQAERWATQNKNLKGDQLKAAVDKQAWDDSLKSLAATPAVLTMMNDKLDWTQKLGDAVLAQQVDVMDAIQRLRSKAHANKKLNTTKEQKVTVKQEQNKQVIVIEPTNPNTIYVPYYNPAVVYGAWPYPAYPPYYWPAPGYIAAGVVATGLAFGAGYALGRWASGGNLWGGGVNWGNNNINVNRNINNVNINNWQHNSAHRHGVKYNNANVQQKFARTDAQAGRSARQDFRGKDGQKVLDPNRDRAGLGDRDRPGGGDRERPGPAIVSALVAAIANGLALVIASGLEQVIVSAPALAIVSAPALAIVSGLAPAIVRAPAEGTVRAPIADRATDRNPVTLARANGNVTRLFPASNREGRLARKPIAAARASGEAEEVNLPVAAAAAAAVASAVAAVGSGVVAVALAEAVAAAAAAVAGGPTSRSSTTSCCSAISTTASASTASHITAATRPMSA
jgi:hypothetical protein